MKNKKTIYEHGAYRIVEIEDQCYSLDNLMGECYCPKVNPEIPVEQLEKEKKEFLEKVEREGVYGYVLEKWNPSIGCGWEHIDSCWGFVGTHEDENHYIVEELKSQITKTSEKVLIDKKDFEIFGCFLFQVEGVDRHFLLMPKEVEEALNLKNQLGYSMEKIFERLTGKIGAKNIFLEIKIRDKKKEGAE